MHIRFARQPVRFSLVGILFDGWVDDQPIVCEISSEALIEQFGASPSRTGCLIAFNAHRAEIEAVAARAIPHRLAYGRCSIFCRDFHASPPRFPDRR
ncbi:DUF1488 family protein [Paraburkholderia tropica]|uniref:DUF1488 family protein n=1 Tax=Paraburkholderia tropica TaxID=92647 RepID=UPI000A7763DE|nr:DUF1488 family protein [Paraburkholderia tropica]